ncbi:hypothetical protein LTR48_002507 [Friedmanniomyces endolithicus]|uniref:Uncharacterized protein n=1 Tax=Rachicladosporium monterosium TaxID=1507873 RepID=A0ABR0LB15_9PEZI|nr:hypothetical protein LTR29_017291 [Friedmanniomyces endolithicus]KAK1093353.1 hypothetical protein LTR48_002507 [Friedmanniomyces endolithicus]KAK5146193.1 hypothetical protein LTR32_002179 [Rachicladosporium monterosium]
MSSGTLANVARSSKGTLPSRGTQALTWDSPSHLRHARIKAGSDHWLTTSTKTGVSGVTLRVHFNTLDGELLVNGLPLGQPPRKYEEHASYRTLFGHSAIEVLPSAVPGMQFTAKSRFSGHQLQFGMGTRPAVAANDLLVQATQHEKRYEFLPPDLFRNIFPAAFVEEHVHWYGLDDGVVHFRPSKDLWNIAFPTLFTNKGKHSTHIPCAG